MGFLMLLHPLANLEIQKYYQNEPRFNGIYSRGNLPNKTKERAYIINLDEYTDVGTHWISLFSNRSEIVYFGSLGVEHVPEEIKEFIANRNIKLTFFAYKQTIRSCVGTFALDSLILCLQAKN